MKKLSITTKITLWFSIDLIIVVTLTYFVILGVSDQIIKKTIIDSLIEVVENNFDEIEYFASIDDVDLNNDVDYFIEYNNGYIEVDDDFLDEVNSVYTGLYSSDQSLIYGENPIAYEISNLGFIDSQVQKIKVDGTLYYIFDRKLTYEGLEDLWIRGIVSEKQGETQLALISKTSLIVMPTLVLFTILGGYIIARRTLNPIKKINDEINEIGKSRDLNRRLKLDKGNDELHVLGENFNNMLDKINESFKNEKQFTTDASHELRTPMSVIMAQCELLLEDKKKNDEYIEGINLIKRQGKKMTTLINDMLIFTRMEQNKDEIVFNEVDMTELVNSVCYDMSLIKDKNIKLKKEIEDNIKINGNEELLVRLLTNLISNSYRYGKKDGYILVSLRKQNNNIVLSVEDNGIGIDENKQDKIFNRFYQVDEAHSKEGSGLGLSMVLEITKIHHGTIDVKSKIDKGSTFIITLPIN